MVIDGLVIGTDYAPGIDDDSDGESGDGQKPPVVPYTGRGHAEDAHTMGWPGLVWNGTGWVALTVGDQKHPVGQVGLRNS